LLGPNGAGKTTTFYMVVGIVPRDAGNIIIDDEDISLLPLHARARRGSAICRRKPPFSVA
jgi:lipopolysaccharide export system ATP-binding protein